MLSMKKNQSSRDSASSRPDFGVPDNGNVFYSLAVKKYHAVSLSLTILTVATVSAQENTQ
jgi:hypothetical protein